MRSKSKSAKPLAKKVKPHAGQAGRPRQTAAELKPRVKSAAGAPAKAAAGLAQVTAQLRNEIAEHQRTEASLKQTETMLLPSEVTFSAA